MSECHNPVPCSTEEDSRLSDEEREMLLKQYDTLVELSKQQHQRRQIHSAILVGILLMLLGGIAKSGKDAPGPLITTAGAALGMIISVCWICISARIKIEADLRWKQLHHVEELLRPSSRVPSISAETRLHFFPEQRGVRRYGESPGEAARIRWPGGWEGWFGDFSVVKCLRWVQISFCSIFLFLFIHCQPGPVHISDEHLLYAIDCLILVLAATFGYLVIRARSCRGGVT